MAEDLGEKTEAPSGRRLSDARNRGQIARSTELAGTLDLVGAVVLVVYFGGDLLHALAEIMRATLSGNYPGAADGVHGVPQLLGWMLYHGVLAAAPMMGVMFLIVYVIQVQQVGLIFTLEPLQPKLERLNPLGGLGRLMGKRNVFKSGVAIIKLVIIAVVVFSIARRHFPEIAALPMLELIPAFKRLGDIIIEIASWMLLLMFTIGVADFLYQRWQHNEDLKMTKQEVKDERKSGEGDPEVKGRRLRMARSMLMEQMRQSVPTADVIVTNPTHFSVALKYDADAMAAPKVVAKGADYMAFRIRELAAANGIPIVEKPALARALYAKVAVGQEVRPEYYQAVAEVLAYVYRLNQHAAA